MSRVAVRDPRIEVEDLADLEIEGTARAAEAIELPPLHTGQARIEAGEARFTVVVAGRRFGKSFYGVRRAVQSGLRGGRVWWVAPTYSLASEGWEVLMALGSQVPGARIQRNPEDRCVWFPRSGPLQGRVQVRSADNPQSLRGAGLDGVVADEFPLMQETAWTQGLRPTLTDTKGWALFIGTANGRGTWGHRLWQRGWGKDPEVGWTSFQAPTWENPYIDAEEIEAARRDLHPAIFSQEYGAEWIELAGVVPFRAEWLREYTLAERPALRDLWVAIGVDPAISKRDTACQTAIVATGLGQTPATRGMMYVVGAAQGHWTPYETAEQIFRMLQATQPRVLVIEDVAYQRSLADILKREAQIRGLPLPAVRLEIPERDKLRRAMGASPLVESGRVQFGPGQAALQAALLKVPGDASGWDYTDAFGLSLRALPRQERANRTPLLHADGTPRIEAPDRRGAPMLSRAAGYAHPGVLTRPASGRPSLRSVPRPADVLAGRWMAETFGTAGRRRAGSYGGRRGAG
jgi:hypothetical protein